MNNAADVHQALLKSCQSSSTGYPRKEDPGAEEAMVELYNLLYKKAYYYFRYRYSEDVTEELARQSAQKVWEALIRCESLTSIRQPAAYFAFARKAVLRECWRVQNENENEGGSLSPPAPGEIEDDSDWTENLISGLWTDERGAMLYPEGFLGTIRDCLLQALGRLKNPVYRTVVILKYIADLDDEKIAEALQMSDSQILALRRQAVAHGLDPIAISKTLEIPAVEMQASLEWIRAQGLPDEAIAHVIGVAEDRLQSLDSLVKKNGAKASDDRLLVRAFRISQEDIARAHESLKAFPIRRFEVTLAIDQALKEINTRTALAEDHEIALILGATKDNIQVILSRVKKLLREDVEFVKCIQGKGL